MEIVDISGKPKSKIHYGSNKLLNLPLFLERFPEILHEFSHSKYIILKSYYTYIPDYIILTKKKKKLPPKNSTSSVKKVSI